MGHATSMALRACQPSDRGVVGATSRGGRVTTRLVFRFKDGSISDETAVYSQRGHFRLISDHAMQRGPAFEHPVEMTIDVASGVVTVRHHNDHGEEKVE